MGDSLARSKGEKLEDLADRQAGSNLQEGSVVPELPMFIYLLWTQPITQQAKNWDNGTAGGSGVKRLGDGEMDVVIIS